jgi:hypothetical protein
MRVLLANCLSTALWVAAIGLPGTAESMTRRWPLLSSIAAGTEAIRHGQVVEGRCADEGCSLPKAYSVRCLTESRLPCQGTFEISSGSNLRLGARYFFVTYRRGDRKVLLPFETKFHEGLREWVVLYDGSYVPDVLDIEEAGGVRSEYFGYFRLADFEDLFVSQGPARQRPTPRP